MSARLTPGCLAIVVRASTPTGRKSIGKIVEVVGTAQSGEHHGAHYGTCCDQPDRWFIRSTGSLLDCMTDSGRERRLDVIAMPGHNLRPLGGLTDADRDESKAWLPLVPARERVQP